MSINAINNAINNVINLIEENEARFVDLRFTDTLKASSTISPSPPTLC